MAFFPILSLKVDHLVTFVVKPNFNMLCLHGPTWNWNDKLKILCIYLIDREASLLSYNSIPNQVDFKIKHGLNVADEIKQKEFNLFDQS